MQYIIMITIVLVLALSDILTGFLKAHINNDYCSAVMRRGGLRKVLELVMMCLACLLEIGIQMLGTYYQAEQLATITGKFAAFSIFGYITLMEIVSILENYAQAEPNAAWCAALLKKLRTTTKEDENNENLH